MSSRRWHALLAHPRAGGLANLFFWVGVGVEALMPRPFLLWVRRGHADSQPKAKSPAWLRVAPGAALAAAAVAAFAPFPMLMQAGQSLFMSPQATVVFGPHYQDVSPYDVSDMARNAATGDIILCGDTQLSPKLLPGAGGPAVDTKVWNGGNEFCEFSGALNRFVTFDNDSDNLLLVDPKSFAVDRRLHLENMPYGEILLGRTSGAQSSGGCVRERRKPRRRSRHPHRRSPPGSGCSPDRLPGRQCIYRSPTASDLHKPLRRERRRLRRTICDGRLRRIARLRPAP